MAKKIADAKRNSPKLLKTEKSCKMNKNIWRSTFFCVGGATKSSFRKMELLKKLEEEEDINAPNDVPVDKNYNIWWSFLWGWWRRLRFVLSGCDEKPNAHFGQPCGHMICYKPVEKNNSQFCGCWISNNKTIDFNYYFHVF